MTTMSFPQQQVSRHQGSRHGEPWNDDDYEALISEVREGSDDQRIAAAIGRARGTILTRVRKLLPVDMRRCPADRVLPAARVEFARDDYDWRVTILQSPPPAPIVTPPAIVRHGIAGLSADDLGTIAFSLALTGGTQCAELLARVCAELPTAPGSRRIAEDLAIQWLRRSGALLHGDEHAVHAANDWLASADGWSREYARRYSWEPDTAWDPEPWDAPLPGWAGEPA
ncbi:hypothetical protein [Paramicrobacterium fandaimingii]|uniref:hypothetical protein n=1 Tax=Paramicrobacterium fandaimingii TaxID=2708079 RepID=UPI001421E951|nr:hypothetical protein [Microbacterium fandaimingii]